METDNLYLILHKVRGALAFDIAERMCLDGNCSNPNCGLRREDSGCLAHNEGWWQIPTSGHSAYPLAYWKLSELADVSVGPEQPRPYDAVVYDAVTQDDLDRVQDHYAIIDPQKPVRQGLQMAAQGQLQLVGLAQDSKPFQRRA